MNPEVQPDRERIEAAILSVKGAVAHCRVLSSGEPITLRASGVQKLVPGEIATVAPRRRWIYGGNSYLSGEVESTRLDAGALGLVPLKLAQCGVWDPAQHYWGEDGEPIDEWAKPIVARGSRQQFEMEQILPGEDPDDLSDPILDANDLKDSGDYQGAREILMRLCREDLRCLDAHAHLGNLFFETRPRQAVRHYEAGLRIGELALGKRFSGLLPWGFIDNRPFLRCMSGFGLCLWRLERFEEAYRIFGRMLWLNPSDNQGVRFLLHEVQNHKPWTAGDDR